MSLLYASSVLFTALYCRLLSTLGSFSLSVLFFKLCTGRVWRSERSVFFLYFYLMCTGVLPARICVRVAGSLELELQS